MRSSIEEFASKLVSVSGFGAGTVFMLTAFGSGARGLETDGIRQPGASMPIEITKTQNLSFFMLSLG
jgi:hypothetical protein